MHAAGKYSHAGLRASAEEQSCIMHVPLMDVLARSPLHGFSSHDHHALPSLSYTVISKMPKAIQHQHQPCLTKFWMQMCIADGPSLPLDEQLHRLPQLPLLHVVHLLSLGWISVLCKLTSSTLFACLCSFGFASSCPCFSMCFSDVMLCSAICTLNSTSLFCAHTDHCKHVVCMRHRQLLHVAFERRQMLTAALAFIIPVSNWHV